MLPGKHIVDEEELMGTLLTRIASDIKWVKEVVTEVTNCYAMDVLLFQSRRIINIIHIIHIINIIQFSAFGFGLVHTWNLLTLKIIFLGQL